QPLLLTVRADHATVYGFYTSFLDIKGEVRDSVFEINVDAKNLRINESPYFDNFAIVARFENDVVLWELDWTGTSSNGDGGGITGNLGGRMTTLADNQISFNVQTSELFLGSQIWQFDPDNSILIDSIGVRFENIRFYNQNDPSEYLSLNGDLSREPNSVLEFSFERYQLSPWAPIIERIGLDFDGTISGNISIFDFYTILRFNTDLKIEDFSINAFNYGTAFLRTIADEEVARSFISFSVQDDEKTYLSANGYFYSVDEERNLDLSISVSDMDLSLLKNYVKTFSSSLTGTFSGELMLDGSLRSPNFHGDLTLDNAVMKVDFLNTYYAINPEKVVFSLDSIIFVNTNLEDMVNRTQATLSGGLHHNRFGNFRLGINVETNNFLALNTTRSDNEDFFGRVFLTGYVNLTGPVENILIDVQGRTERGTELQINYSSRVNISEANQFIHFVVPERNPEEENIFLTYNRAAPDLDVPTNIIVRLDIDVTPDATVFFDMDAPPISGLIQAQGSGNLRMNIDSRTQEFTLFGDYVLQDGFYDFTFEDPLGLGLGRLVTRRFYIERGGTLQWTGEPGNMILDVSAVYSTRASLAPVFANQPSTSGNTMRRVNVQSVISLAGRMSQPDIRFDFRLPAVDENTRTEFFTAINRDDENEMMRQTFFLLLFGGFTTPGENIAFAENISGEAMVWDALINQANSMLNFGDNINFSASYRPGDIHSTAQTQFSMGAQFLDNRLLIDGHVGQGGLSRVSGVENSTQTLMELNVEYRITDRLSIRGFNRPNERDFSRGSPQVGYSQGAGIAYRREFNSFRLFNRNRRREE
ncbi:MAG: translocation/assembly module TamB, partial [Bacteroidales bacterium]|nr:translocation/assembly module TamB [Bacteroidales bacterium]